MGRTFLDIDMARAADLLGMERRQAEQIRDLERGRFLALGPAISRRPVSAKIGAVRTHARTSSHTLIPLPGEPTSDLEDLLTPQPGDAQPELFAALIAPAPAVDSSVKLDEAARDEALAAEAILAAQEPQGDIFAPDPNADREAAIRAIMLDMAAEEDCTYRSTAVLFQDFAVRCRMQRIANPGLDMPSFGRRFALPWRAARKMMRRNGKPRSHWLSACRAMCWRPSC